VLTPPVARAADGAADALRPPLQPVWVHGAPLAPDPAWPDPARQDFWNRQFNLAPAVAYDRAFHPVAAGGAVYYGSSADDGIHALDAATGARRWSYYTEGPVRAAPVVAGDLVLAGSDDGRVYALAASDGALRWRYRPGPRDARLMGNGRMISRWPVRSGVVVEGGAALVAAGLFPVTEGAWLAAVDVSTGRGLWKRAIDQPAQGVAAAAGGCLVLPAGRTPPGVYALKDGAPAGRLSGPGGDFVAAAGAGVVATGPGEAGSVALVDAATRKTIVELPALRIAVAGDRAYVQSRTGLAALDLARFLPAARRKAEADAKVQALKSRSDEAAKQEKADAARQAAAAAAEMRAAWLWRAPCGDPHALLLAGDLLVAGGEGRVSAHRASDGKAAWSAPVAGRAHALAGAGGRILVGTSHGAIVCFGPGGAGPAAAPDDARGPAAPRAPETADPALLAGWVFRREAQRDGAVADLAGRAPAKLAGTAALDRAEPFDALVLDGEGRAVVTEDMASPALPRGPFTVEAWVRVDTPLEWGGIAGILQDNGSYEKGWLLGYCGDRFSFAVAGSAGSKLTYLSAAVPYAAGRWHHAAGTYDGSVMTVYVDGAPAGTSREQSGPVAYPPKGFFDLGAYHDDNELHAMTGAIHEVRVYKRALGVDDIRKRYEAKAGLVPADDARDPPEIRAGDDGTVTMAWAASGDTAASVEYGVAPGRLEKTAAAAGTGGRLTAALAGLEPGATVWYRVVVRGRPAGTRPRAGPVFSFRAPPRPFAGSPPLPASDSAAEAIPAGVAGPGLALVLGAGDGRLAWEIAKRTGLGAIDAGRDASAAEAARRALGAAGTPPSRVALHILEGDVLPYPDGVFALIVADREAVGIRPAELVRVLRPWGGALAVRGASAAALEAWRKESTEAGEALRVETGAGGWTVVRRGPLAGAGAWTHGQADPGQTGSSGDRLVSGPLVLQWFGRPGPREMADRHHRAVPPLAKDGRLFIAGDDLLLAADAFNGIELWRRDLPGTRRLGVFLDSSHLAVDDRALYAAAGEACLALDPATGRTTRTVPLPAGAAGAGRAWGIVTAVDGLLLGSARKAEAAYTAQSREADAILWGDKMELVTSAALFAVDPATGASRWTYTGGAILNPTVCAGEGRVWFIETRHPKALAAPTGRVPMEAVADAPGTLVALDLRTGQPVWRREIGLANCRHIVFLSCARGTLLLTGNRYVDSRLWYFFTGIDASTGKTLWERSHNAGYKPGGDHGEQNRRPVIVGGTVYTDPLAYDLKTGEPVRGWTFDRCGHGCGGISASAGTLFWRGGNPWRWDLKPGAEAARLNTETRPGCWLNMIPASGLLLIPEASSGCTCAYPLQTSLAYAPARP
jgi:outer membrane protein assembly factor BamB